MKNLKPIYIFAIAAVVIAAVAYYLHRRKAAAAPAPEEAAAPATRDRIGPITNLELIKNQPTAQEPKANTLEKPGTTPTAKSTKRVLGLDFPI